MMLRRLKQLGASQTELKDIYEKQVRSILEFAAVVWHPGLTKKNTAQIERVQKSAFAIILGQNYTSYENALCILNMETLSNRLRKPWNTHTIVPGLKPMVRLLIQEQLKCH